MNDWQLFIRDNTGSRVAVGNKFLRFSAVFNFNDVGKFALALRDSSYESELISWGAGIDLAYNGNVIFGGNFTRIAETGSSSGGYAIRVNGEGDNAYLANAICYPDPADVTPPLDTQAYDVRTGAAESVMKNYVKYNIGSLAATNRQVPGLTVETDSARGTTVTGRARFDNLLEMLQLKAIEGGGLGFRIVDKQFQVYEPVNKAGQVVFSKGLGNLLSYEYFENAAKANVVLAGGTGEGTARNFAYYVDSDSVLLHGRRETFYDRRNVSDLAELATAAGAKAQKVSQVYGVAFEPTFGVGASFNPVDDYDLGDTIKLITNRGTSITAVVRQLVFSMVPNQKISFVPVIGTEGANIQTAFAATNKRIAALESAMNNLERI